MHWQEYIPVGCVPSAAVAVCWGVSAQGGCLPQGCLPGECLPRGVSAQGVSAQGVSAQGASAQEGVSQHALRQIPPVDRILDTRLWKYYLAATLLRTLIIQLHWKSCSVIYFKFNCTAFLVSNRLVRKFYSLKSSFAQIKFHVVQWEFEFETSRWKKTAAGPYHC